MMFFGNQLDWIGKGGYSTGYILFFVHTRRVNVGYVLFKWCMKFERKIILERSLKLNYGQKHGDNRCLYTIFSL